MSVSKCNGPECDRESIAFGLCHAHYKQFKKDKPLTPLRNKAGNNTVTGLCEVNGYKGPCPNVKYCRGICKAHYEKFRRKSLVGEDPDDNNP